MINRIINKILYKIYIHDVFGFILISLKLDIKYYKVINYLYELDTIEKKPDEILNLTTRYFSSRKIFYRFFKACELLVKQIVLEPSENYLNFNMDGISDRELKLLNRIADSFGRFDLGYQLRLQYCNKIENKILNGHPSRKDAIKYMLNMNIFGNELFNHEYMNIKLKVPFFLKTIHIKTLNFSFDHEIAMKTNYFNKINKKRIALLAPGILEFTTELINELKSFDEIVTINYKLNHYNFNLPITVSYYNHQSTNKLLMDTDYIKSTDLDFYCTRKNASYSVKIREIFKDSFKWQIGFPNMVQFAIYDLLVHSPSRIKIFGANFYLSPNPYHPKYESTNISLVVLAYHNVISNFMYISNLYSRGLIELDNDAQRIIDDGVERYSKNMTMLYKLDF
jgi:hypothetical protein